MQTLGLRTWPIQSEAGEMRPGHSYFPQVPLVNITLKVTHYSLGKSPACACEQIKGKGRHVHTSAGTATHTWEQRWSWRSAHSWAFERQDSRFKSLTDRSCSWGWRSRPIKLLLPKASSDDCWKPQFSAVLDSSLSTRPPKSKGLHLFWADDLPVTYPWQKHLLWAQWTWRKNLPRSQQQTSTSSLTTTHCFHLPRPVSGPRTPAHSCRQVNSC